MTISTINEQTDFFSPNQTNPKKKTTITTTISSRIDPFEKKKRKKAECRSQRILLFAHYVVTSFGAWALFPIELGLVYWLAHHTPKNLKGSVRERGRERARKSERDTQREKARGGEEREPQTHWA